MSDVTYGVKVPDELKAQLEELQKNSGLRTGKDFLQQLANCYVLEKTKETIPEVAEDLKELQVLTQRIDNIYLNLGYRIDNITKAQQEENRLLLNKKESIILGLQVKNEELTASYEILTTTYNNLVNEKNECIQRVNELTESNNTTKELSEKRKEENAMLVSLVNEYKEYKDENKKLEDRNKWLEQDKERMDPVIKEERASHAELTEKHGELKNEFNDLKKSHAEEIERIKAANLIEIAEKIKVSTEKGEFEKEKALLATEKATQAEINKIKEDAAQKISEYQDKYKNLLQEIEENQKNKSITQAERK